jgi:hypothetical protein
MALIRKQIESSKIPKGRVSVSESINNSEIKNFRKSFITSFVTDI